MKNLIFVLPALSKKPIGGYKIVFEYANRLAMLGYSVTIIFPLILTLKNTSLKNIIRTYRRYYLKGYFIKKYRIKWFQLNNKIKLKVVPSLDERYMPKGDIIFATARETSYYVNSYRKDKGKKYYLIQGYENWGCSDSEVLNTWKFPLKKIVISKWLGKKLEVIGEKYELIYNGLDFSKFFIKKPIEIRDNNTILCLYHGAYFKGFDYGLEAFKKIKKEYENINIICFGADKRPGKLPKWIEYYCQPSQEKLNELYNKASIFVGTSFQEGWGLTVAEAMQCGCAVVCTDINGYNEMIFNNETGLLCKVKNSDDLAEKIKKLLNDNCLRKELAKRGNVFIQRFSWEKSINKIVELIEK